MMLGCAAVAGVQGVQAQDPLSFKQDFDFGTMVGWPSHRCRAIIADFNNDGLMDMYLNGTSENKGWQSRGVLAKNLGNRQFEGVTDAIMKKDTTYNKVYSTDTLWNDDGSYELQDSILNGEVVMDTVYSETFVGMANGLPRTAFGQGSQPIDFNNDGLVDYIVLNTGSNDTGTAQGYVLIINKGNWQFEVLEDSVLNNLGGLYKNTGGGNFNENTPYGSLVTGDYDNDGFTDVLVCGNGPEGRYTRLLRNVNGERFEDVNVFNPLPFDEEPNKAGLFEETEGSVDPETGVEIPGEYTQVPTKRMRQMSHGSVAFIDIDGDGWLDIVTSGWVDGRENMPSTGIENGGLQVRFYKNLQNGEFQDVTNSPSLIEAVATIFAGYPAWGEPTGTIQDVFKAWGMEEGVTITLDYDQDGRPDLMQLGGQGSRDKKQANCLRNVSDESGFRFEEIATEISPMATASSARFLWADFNGDDYPDYMMTGWTSKTNTETGAEYGWSRVVDLSQGGTSYMNYFYGDGENEFMGAWMAKSDPSVNSFGDLDGDGLLDLFTSDYTSYAERNDQQIINWNTSTNVEVTQPDAVGEVTATAEKGRVVVNWEASEMNNGNFAIFNVYIKNNETGATRMVVPANIETGKPLAYAMFGCYVNAGNEDGEASYVFDKLPAGDYTVGVQAVNYAYQVSEWTTTEVSVTESDYSSVASQVAGKGMKVSVDGNSITVLSDEPASVKVYSMQGAEVGAGVTGEAITVNGHGVFLVKAAGQVTKIVK